MKTEIDNIKIVGSIPITYTEADRIKAEVNDEYIDKVDIAIKKTAEKIFADIEKHLDKLFPVIWPMSREDFEEIKKKYLGEKK